MLPTQNSKQQNTYDIFCENRFFYFQKMFKKSMNHRDFLKIDRPMHLY